jgi:hypothetical protein
MSLLADLYTNAHYIEPILGRQVSYIFHAIHIAESNSNEVRVIENLRTLISSFSNPRGLFQSIKDYLDAPETQFSATREMFVQIQNEQANLQNDRELLRQEESRDFEEQSIRAQREFQLE